MTIIMTQAYFRNPCVAISLRLYPKQVSLSFHAYVHFQSLKPTRCTQTAQLGPMARASAGYYDTFGADFVHPQSPSADYRLTSPLVAMQYC